MIQSEPAHALRSVPGRAGKGERDPIRGGQSHQRDDGHGPDRQRATGAEQRISDDGEDRSVEADFGRQPREHRISEALWDQHDRDYSGRDEIVG